MDGQAIAEEVERLLHAFREKAEPLGVTVRLAASDGDAARAVADWAQSLEADSIIVASEVTKQAPGIEAVLSSAGLHDRPPASPAEARDAPLGLSMGHLAIAET